MVLRDPPTLHLLLHHVRMRGRAPPRGTPPTAADGVLVPKQ